MFLLLVTCLTIVAQCFAQQPEIVETEAGLVQGSISTSYGGRRYLEFLGVPYASPPIGDLRFEDPEPVKPWTGVRIGNFTSDCIQVTHAHFPNGGISLGTEDCLHLSIFVPGTRINRRKKLGVIMNIHGGAFMFGSGNSPGPKFLMDRDVILVSINYRVGVFGFLSTGDRNLPGNLGMKDQVMALRWIRRNIAYFGGNKNSVMITGLSAGGASVEYHYLSPLSRGLFHRGISHSGCVLNPWTIQEEPLKKAKIIGSAVRCTQEGTKELVACLKKVPAEQLNEAVRGLRSWLMNPFSPLALVVDKDSKNPFLPEHPYKMLLNGKVHDIPWISGVTTSEGLYPAADFVLEERYLTELRTHWEEYAPDILHYTETTPNNSMQTITQKIKEYYLGSREVGFNTFKEIVQLIGDRLFVADIEKSARLHSNAVLSPVYLYQFDYMVEKRISFATFFTGNPQTYGVCHGDDNILLFSYSLDNTLTMSPRDEEVKDALLDMYTSFLKIGIPKPRKWSPVRKNNSGAIKFLHIGADRQLKMRSANELGHRSFWESFNFKENENLIN